MLSKQRIGAIPVLPVNHTWDDGVDFNVIPDQVQLGSGSAQWLDRQGHIALDRFGFITRGRM